MKKFSHISGRFYETDGAAIYYEGIGDPRNPAVLLLHGGMGNMEDFNELLPIFRDRFFILGIDSRGQGRSTLGNRPLTYEQMAQDVAALLKFLHIESMIVVGFSDGGIVGYRLAAMNAIKVVQLVTIGSNGNADDLADTHGLYAGITATGWKEKFPHMFNSYQRLNPEPDFDGLITAIKALWLDEGTTGYPNELLRQISCPTLIIRGDDDHLFSRQSAVKLANELTGAALFNIPFAGHEVFRDQPEIFAIVLSRFLAG